MKKERTYQLTLIRQVDGTPRVRKSTDKMIGSFDKMEDFGN